MAWRDEDMVDVHFDEVLHITDKGGYKLLIGDDEVWFPVQACPDLEEFDIGDGPGEFECPERLATEKGVA